MVRGTLLKRTTSRFTVWLRIKILGRFSLDGIRVNDYNNGTNTNQIIRNNRITIYGANSLYYERGQHYLNGICNVSNGPGNVFEGNVIARD